MNARAVRDIEYQLLPGSERSTTDIVIERNGMIAVRPPKGLTPEQADAVVESKRMWIYQNLAEWRDLNAASVVREWVNGESFLYLGRNYRLALVSDQDVDLRFNEGRFYLNRHVIDKDGAQGAKDAFERFYTEKGLLRIKQRVKHFAPKVGVQPERVSVKNMGYRWASCTKKGDLNFHWKCIMAPLKIIDYIVVHELCHFHYRNHSEAFWNEVDKVMPDYTERKVWLASNGASLDI